MKTEETVNNEKTEISTPVTDTAIVAAKVGHVKLGSGIRSTKAIKRQAAEVVAQMKIEAKAVFPQDYKVPAASVLAFAPTESVNGKQIPSRQFVDTFAKMLRNAEKEISARYDSATQTFTVSALVSFDDSYNGQQLPQTTL